jgi:hypothetical protein
VAPDGQLNYCNVVFPARFELRPSFNTISVTFQGATDGTGAEPVAIRLTPGHSSISEPDAQQVHEVMLKMLLGMHLTPPG